jgi:hypothetical protein
MVLRWSLKLFLWLLFAAVAFSLGCVGGDRPAPRPILKFFDATGWTVTEIDEATLPTIFSQITNLPAGRPFELMLYRDGRPLYRDAQGNPQPIVATSDEKGEITAVIFYDLGVDP